MILSENQIADLQKAIEVCIAKLYGIDPIIIERGGMERSVSFRFALYLNEEKEKLSWLNGLFLDMEYNKNGDKAKITMRKKYGAQPDIIIHNRGLNDANVLVLEMKGWWDKRSRADDFMKLEDFTHQEGEYKYGLGVFLELDKNDCKPTYFKGY